MARIFSYAEKYWDEYFGDRLKYNYFLGDKQEV
jgi:hypothetical protein